MFPKVRGDGANGYRCIGAIVGQFNNLSDIRRRIRDPEARLGACRTAKSPMSAFDPLRTLGSPDIIRPCVGQPSPELVYSFASLRWRRPV
jgi:hypothetical protein